MWFNRGCVLGIMSLDELTQRLIAARGRNKQEISRLFFTL